MLRCKIPVFIINLQKRYDRRTHVLNQFRGRDEFDVTIIPAIEHPVGGFGLSQTVLSIIEHALDTGNEFVLICEDDHSFTSDYDYSTLCKLIDRCDTFEADVLVGGPSWFDYSVKVGENLCWLNAFTGTQFLIVFKRFYQTLYNYRFEEHEHIDHTISKISDHIFTINPIVSVQSEFGYSDVSFDNNEFGAVRKLYDGIINRLLGLEKIYSYAAVLNGVNLQQSNYDDYQISTYIINIPERVDRLVHAKHQFFDKKEFETHIVEACRSEHGALGLWNSIKKVIQHAVNEEEDVIIICEDDHTFSEAYSKETLFGAIIQGAHLGADLILGGISNTSQAIVVSSELCWVDTFQCTQFTIVYRSLFEDILMSDFDESDAADLKLSILTGNKYVIHPFISNQKDFGYSDIPINGIDTADYQNWFLRCEQKLNKIRLMNKRFKFQ